MTAAVELPVRECAFRARPHESRRASLTPRPEPPERARIVVADPDAATREMCATILRDDGYAVTTCVSAEQALARCAASRVDILIIADGNELVHNVSRLRRPLTTDRGPLLIVLAQQPSVAASLAATQAGAFAYLPKPFAACHLQVLVGRAAHTRGLDPDVTGSGSGLHPVHRDPAIPLGTSRAFRRALEMARKVAATSASVFITGESGSGKELIAQLIHAESRRSRQAFVAVNCAAIPDGLLETEMFGHRKGAFTGAVRDKPGLLEAADGGTLFLDELLELPLPLQAKLLRVTQDGVIRRVGSEATDAVVDVRLIAATNADPERALRTGGLRPDLYYRLRVVPIHVPPLRERHEDIPLLANHFLAASWQRHRGTEGPPPHLSDTAMRVLVAQPWRGNVRELQNLVEHVSVLATPGGRISASDLPLTPSVGVVSLPRAAPLASAPVGLSPEADASVVDSYHALRDHVIAQFERHYVATLLRRAGGSMTAAACMAAVPRSTLYRMIERHGNTQRGAATPSVAPARTRRGEPSRKAGGRHFGAAPDAARETQPGGRRFGANPGALNGQASGAFHDPAFVVCDPV